MIFGRQAQRSNLFLLSTIKSPNSVVSLHSEFPVVNFLTYMFIEDTADPCQQGECDQITQTGCDGGGYVVRVDPHLPGTNDHSNHHKACGSGKYLMHAWH